ncbi:hypothetical protein KJ365_08650 [Glaciecola sp. XM2]|jgi:hypothetical protein|uniref:hypothetical protein n=1 Tax=Glaciecola sp. XM2 TaxID=1914931 RepID=UPI001BDF2EE4|nr:hypothetical protein [Glaciecola sp. XM2]MBT1450948.1 hypothetical protein [Glaciecola sp. XM2]
MDSVSTINQGLFVNPESGTPKARVAQTHPVNNTEQDKPENTNYVVRSGSKQAMSDAEAIFARANSYADISGKAQKSLQAYEAIEVSMKREAVSKLMGVDIYA